MISPHGVLHYFPFAALVTQPDQNPAPKMMLKPRFLIDDVEAIASSPSLTQWRLITQEQPQKIENVAALGIEQMTDHGGAPRIPGAAKDLVKARLQYKDRLTEVRREHEATETQSRNLLSRPGLIQFSLHGTTDVDHPLESHLLLYSDAENDGRLTAGEIYDLKIQRSVVLLGACHTGLGDRTPLPGDDIFGLQRAFHAAGARTVVAGLWDVSDTTAPVLLGEFHRNFVNGDSVALSLAKSQRTFLNQYRASTKPERFLHPYYWAVYVISGDHRTCFEK